MRLISQRFGPYLAAMNKVQVKQVENIKSVMLMKIVLVKMNIQEYYYMYL